MSVRTSSLLPITCTSPPSSRFSPATASATSPASSVEFSQASGSTSVLEATYFGFALSGSAITRSSSGACGQ